MLGKYMKNYTITASHYFAGAFVLFLTFISSAYPAFAQDVSFVAGNITDSAEDLPGLASAAAYLLGLIFGVRGILKLKAHVENPGNSAGQTPLRTPIISFFAGGALFALPFLYTAVTTTINGGATGGFGYAFSNVLGTGLFGGLNGSDDDLNTLFGNITTSLRSLPGLISAISYLLAIIITIMGVIKVKEHVETPEQVKVNEGVIRILIGGALFTLPTIYNAMFNTVEGTGGVVTALLALAGSTIGFESNLIDGKGASCLTTSGSMGALMCDILTHTGAFPAFLTAIAYLFGLAMGLWGVLKIRDHVLNPQQTGVFEGISRLIAGGGFFAVPVVVEIFRNTFASAGTFGVSVKADPYNYGSTGLEKIANGIIGGGACPSGTGLGLDGVLLCFATDILGPVHVLLNFFAFVAGMIFIMIGISRLIKGAQEGAKAPGGLGTLMTFGMGGALISYNEIIRAASSTFTGDSTTATYAKMQYTKGMTTDETAAAHAVITSIIKFMIVIGIISFVRGLFIVRSVAEGNQQASMMAAVTHIVGGALAVNLGPVINAVQTTLGTTGFGIEFT